MNTRSLPPCRPSSILHAALSCPRPAAAHSPPTACRCALLPAPRAARPRRPFHSSRRLFQDGPPAADGPSHYDTLNVPFGAPVADIKKSFYKLSKVHHPDHNPRDPHAPRRFMRLSEAYAVLSHAERRAVYDRDVMPHHQHRQRGPHRANASYHSTGPAGGRPASGLSRRRSTFRGPPPSFYRNPAAAAAGGGGGDSGGDSGDPTSRASGAAGAGPQRGPAGFGGPGNVNADDAGTRSHPDTPHFDWNKTERTHRNISERMAERRAAAAHEAAYKDEPSMLVGFFIMSAALVAGVLVPVMLFNDWRQTWRTTAEPNRTKPKAGPAGS